MKRSISNSLKFIGIMLGMISFHKTIAANVIEVTPLTNKIIMVKCVDGYLSYHQLNQSRNSDAITLYPGGRISQPTASLTSIYGITSNNDAAYNTAVRPITIGVNQTSETGWDFNINSQKYVQTTILYLFLNTALIEGKNYTVTLTHTSINTSAKSKTFTYSIKTSHSEAVHVNNLGYVPNAAAKYAYVYLWMGDKGSLDLNKTSHIAAKTNRKAKLIRTSDQVEVFNCDVVFRKDSAQTEFGQWGTPNNNFLGASVWECNFSSFNTPGTYVMSVEGIGCSFPFELNANAYREPYYWTMKSLYENRSGIPLNIPFAQYNRPAPHHVGITPGFKLYYSSARHYDLSNEDADVSDASAIDAKIKGQVNTWGWYQDAGDWDSYYTHYKVPAYLMFLYEVNPSKFNALQLDLENESTNSLPDLLDEARWFLRFYKRSKNAIENPLLGGTGGVPGGRVFGDDYNPANGISPEDGHGSWQDTSRKWVMLGENVWTTYQYAALAAHFAEILNKNGLTDPEGIDWRTEAINAWNWSQSKQTTQDETVKWGYNLAYYRMYAAAALYRLTGDKAKYESKFVYDILHCQGEFNYNTNTNDIGFPNDFSYVGNDDTRMFMFTMYSLAANLRGNADAAIKTKVEGGLLASTDFLLGSNTWPYTISNRACRWGGSWWIPMGIGQSTTPYIQLAPLAILALGNSNPTKSADWLKNMYTTADYFLGTNPLNMTYISGLGERSPSQFFHMDSWYSANTVSGAIPKKGFIPYGTMRDCQQDLGSCWGYPGAYMYYYGFREGKAYPMGKDDQLSGSSSPERPGHERFVASRTSPLANENTIHQTQIAAAVVYGFLWSKTGTGNLITQIEKDNLEAENKSLFQIYPNPTQGLFSIDAPIGTKIEVLNGLGVSIVSLQVEHSPILIDLSGKSGMYLVKVNNGITARKLIIE